VDIKRDLMSRRKAGMSRKSRHKRKKTIRNRKEREARGSLVASMVEDDQVRLKDVPPEHRNATIPEPPIEG
jgi:hypothetical protein